MTNQLPFILGIGGTTRPGSSTEAAVRFCLATAAAQGAETAIIAGHDLDLPMYSPTALKQTDRVDRLLTLLRRCDGLILGSPGYHGSISGLMKNALDYVEDLRGDPLPYLHGRAVGCIACAAGWQAAGSTLAALRSIVHALRGWPTPLGATINSETSPFDRAGKCLEPSVKLQLETISRQVVDFARFKDLLSEPGTPKATVAA